MKYKEMIEKCFEQYKQDLAQLISIPSVLDESNPLFPFGENIDLALNKTLEIATRLGFKTYCDPEGYYGYAEIGDGTEMLGILGHLDVVPPGDLKKWSTNPFEAVELDGKIFGRGTQDDKGPLLASLYAVIILKELGYTFSKRIRFIFGTDEESLWRDIPKYMEKEEVPTIAFSPDSKFPLIYAEKGLLQFKLIGKNETDLRFKGGDAFNSVPSEIKYSFENNHNLLDALNTLGFEYEQDRNSVTIIGKSVHAQVAEEGINAISRLLITLKKCNISSKTIDFITDLINEDPYGLNIFGEVSDEASGKLKMNIGKIILDEQVESLSIDIRIPVLTTKEFVVTHIQKAASQYGLEYVEHDYLRSIYVPTDSFLIQELMGAYQTVTGDYVSQPVASGGATYARSMDNCVAFGAVLVGSKKTEHQPNEHIIIDDMKTAIEIYMEAIRRLAV